MEKQIIQYEVEIKNCPFCNSKAVVKITEGYSDYDYGRKYYDVRCTNDECYLSDGADWNSKNVDEIIKLWNNRK